jgi:NTE family protein
MAASSASRHSSVVRRLSSVFRRPSSDTKRINLALQGGGAHGAFTWGVLDYLLEDGRFTICGISGTSAGAMNAVMLADGLARGGPAEARKRLAEFWHAASDAGNLPGVQRTVIDRLFSFLPYETSPAQLWFNALSRFLSPYDLNPLNINPLRDLIERFVDFDAIRGCRTPQLYISATNVHTGHLRVFPPEKINADVVMASACLPFLFRAVEIDGVPYWDGGYMGNPAIFPLFRIRETEDVFIVQINPIERKMTPTSSQEIMNRINEITFNSSLIGELRAIEFVARLIDEGRLPHGTRPGQYRRIKLHRISLDDAFRKLSADSKLSSDYDFFTMLRNGGRRAARNFLQMHFDDIGRKSTVDLSAEIRAEWA